MARLDALVAGFLFWLLQGCNVSPQPNPPSVDPGGVEVVSSGMDMVMIRGITETVDLPGARLSALNLTAFGYGEGLVGMDGSFEIEVPGVVDHVYRLQAADGLLYGAPIDVRSSDPMGGGGVMPVPAYAGCVAIMPGELFIDLGPIALGDIGTAVVTLTSECMETALVEDVLPPGAGMSPFAVNHGDLPLQIAPGRSRTIAVTYRPFVEGESIDVLVIRLLAPEPAEVAITVLGTGVAE